MGGGRGSLAVYAIFFYLFFSIAVPYFCLNFMGDFLVFNILKMSLESEYPHFGVHIFYKCLIFMLGLFMSLKKS